MRRLLYLLLALLGFAVSSCRVEYGCPPVEYEENKESNQNSTERVEPQSADENIYE